MMCTDCVAPDHLHRYRGGMFIRRTQTRSARSGEAYFTFRLVCSERIGSKVRQRTLLNL